MSKKSQCISYILMAVGCLYNMHFLQAEEGGLLYRCQEKQTAIEHFFKQNNLRGDEQILDIGCGDGTVTTSIASKLSQGNILAIDCSKTMIEFAKSRYENIYKNVQFLVKDAMHMEAEQKYDLITSFSSMHWILDQKTILQKCYQGLKPNGKLWIEIPLGIPEALIGALQKVVAEEKWRSYFIGFSPSWRFYSPAEYRDLLEDMRFKTTFLQVYDHEGSFPSKRSFEKYIQTWLPYLQKIPSEKREEFIAEISRAYLEKEPLTSEGSVKFAFRKMDVEAVKR